MGAHHVLVGWDHLAFLLCLLVLMRLWRHRWKRTVTALTAFTVGHSVTLAMASLELLFLDARTSETLIAVSIVLLAAEMVRTLGAPKRLLTDARLTYTARAPELVALTFGLVHGLGFARVLASVGLPPGAALPALAGFNIGVELAQIGVALVASLPLLFGLHLPSRQWIIGPAYGLGVFCSAVALERLLL